MLMLITYDISLEDGKDRQGCGAVAKFVSGLRRARAVFGCLNATSHLTSGCFKRQTFENYNPETDSLRFYHLGSKWRHKVEHHGAKPAVDVFKDTLIV